MSQVPYITPEIDDAVYLVLKGFKLIGIHYLPRGNDRMRGFFIFEPSDRIVEVLKLKDSDGSISFIDFQNEKNELLDRIKEGRP